MYRYASGCMQNSFKCIAFFSWIKLMARLQTRDPKEEVTLSIGTMSRGPIAHICLLNPCSTANIHVSALSRKVGRQYGHDLPTKLQTHTRWLKLYIALVSLSVEYSRMLGDTSAGIPTKSSAFRGNFLTRRGQKLPWP